MGHFLFNEMQHKTTYSHKSLSVGCLCPVVEASLIGSAASPKIGGCKMFDFRRITLFSLGYRLSKNKCSKNLVGPWPRSTHGYIYVSDTIVPWAIPVCSVSGSKSETIVHCFVWHSISVFNLDLTCFIVENVRTLTRVGLFVSKRRAHF